MSNTSSLLPNGWVRTTLGDITEITTGKLDANAAVSEGEYPFFTCADEISRINNFAFDQEAILLAGNGNFGVKWYKGKFNVYQRTYVITPMIHGKYIYYGLMNSLAEITGKSRGSTIKYLRLGDVTSTSLLIAPLKEQTRIVDKIEELFSDLDDGVVELKAAQTKLNQYRQSLLKSAVEGSLTAEWRVHNQASESGEQLLQRILKERREYWEKEKLAEFEAKGKKPPKDWQKKYPEPVQPDTNDLPDLPKSWVWASIDQLAINKRYGTSSKTSDDSNGIPVLRMGNIQDGTIDYKNLKYLPKEHEEFPNLFLEDGDLLFNRTNSAELVGKTAIYRDIGKPCSYASYLIAVTFSKNFKSDVAAYFINSTLGKAWTASVMNQTAGQANINGTKLGNLAIPLAPLAEQNEIVEIVTDLQEQIITQLHSVEQGLKLAGAQRKNILKDAFIGKLVKQNVKDEPVEIMLEKIRLERAELLKKPRIKRIKKEEKTMKLKDFEVVKNWIKTQPDKFSFDQVLEISKLNYEDLKDIIFDLLESGSLITQEFDAEQQRVMFKRRTK